MVGLARRADRRADGVARAEEGRGALDVAGRRGEAGVGLEADGDGVRLADLARELEALREQRPRPVHLAELDQRRRERP